MPVAVLRPLALVVLLAGAACSFQTFTHSEPVADAGSTIRLTVDASFHRERSDTYGQAHLCVALPEDWADPQVRYARNGDAPVAATASPSNILTEANTQRPLAAAEGLRWRCSSTPSLPANSVGYEEGTGLVDITVPAGVSGTRLVKTLGLSNYMNGLVTGKVATHLLRVGVEPRETFDRWQRPLWTQTSATPTALAIGAGRTVAFNGDGQGASSVDGGTWTRHQLGVPVNGMLAVDGRLLGYNTSIFELTFGEDGTPARTTRHDLNVPIRSMVAAFGKLVGAFAGGVVVSSDAGATWTEVRFPTSREPTAIRASAAELLIFTGTQTLFVSRDGLSWEERTFERALLDGVHGNGRWLAFDEEGVVESLDGGASWSPVRSLARRGSVNALGFADERFLVATDDQRFWVGSGSSGWMEVHTGFAGFWRFFVDAPDAVWGAGAYGFVGRADKSPSIAPEFLTRSLPGGFVDDPVSEAIDVAHGTGAVTLSVVEGALPGGIALEGDMLVGTFTESGVFAFTVRATDSTGRSVDQGFSWSVVGPPKLPDETFLGFIAKSTETIRTLRIEDGVAPFTLTTDDDTSELVSVSLNDREISLVFAPGIAGELSVAFEVRDARGKSDRGSYRVKAVDAPVLNAGELGPVVQGRAFSQRVSVVGEAAPFTWRLVGALPEGLSGSAMGEHFDLAGTTTAAPGAFPITVALVDAAGQRVQLEETLEVVLAPALAVTALPDAVEGRAFEFTLSATGSAPLSWTITGALPAGFSWSEVEGAQRLSGTPTEAGVFPQSVEIVDARGIVTSAVLDFEVLSVPVLDAATLAAATVGVAYEATIALRGGLAPYECSAGPALPGGLALTTVEGACRLSGTPTTAGSFDIAVTVKDGQGLEASATYALQVKPAAVPEVPDEEEPAGETKVETGGCGGCNATSASSLVALLGLGLVGRRRRRD